MIDNDEIERLAAEQAEDDADAFVAEEGASDEDLATLDLDDPSDYEGDEDEGYGDGDEDDEDLEDSDEDEDDY